MSSTLSAFSGGPAVFVASLLAYLGIGVAVLLLFSRGHAEFRENEYSASALVLGWPLTAFVFGLVYFIVGVQIVEEVTR